jgi:drug/metabolite transporter (DMT)-like permease
VFSIIGLQALWASSIPISKILLTFSPPLFLAGIRMTSAGVILLGYRLFKKEKIIILKNHYWLFAQIIFCGIYLKYVLRYWSLTQLPTAKLAFMLNLSPFCIAFFSYFIIKEKLSSIQWAGMILGLSSVFPLLILKNSSEQLITDFLSFSWPELAVFVEIIAYSYAFILTKKVMTEFQYPPALTNAIRMIGGGMLALTTSFLSTETINEIQIAPFIFWLALYIIISNIICHNFGLYLLKKHRSAFIAMSDFLGPLFTAFYGYILFNEIITWHYFISAIMALSGL